METPTLTKLVTDQALAIITKSSPFGHIPLVNSAINYIVASTIGIALNKTVLSGYIKEIEEDVLKQAAKVTEARERLKDKSLTEEERKKHEETLKESLRDFLSFKS